MFQNAMHKYAYSYIPIKVCASIGSGFGGSNCSNAANMFCKVGHQQSHSNNRPQKLANSSRAWGFEWWCHCRTNKGYHVVHPVIPKKRILIQITCGVCLPVRRNPTESRLLWEHISPHEPFSAVGSKACLYRSDSE